MYYCKRSPWAMLLFSKGQLEALCCCCFVNKSLRGMGNCTGARERTRGSRQPTGGLLCARI